MSKMEEGDMTPRSFQNIRDVKIKVMKEVEEEKKRRILKGKL